MFSTRRFLSSSRPREYADLLADAMGEGADAGTARTYASAPGPLRRLLSSRYEDDDEEEDENEEESTDNHEEESKP